MEGVPAIGSARRGTDGLLGQTAGGCIVDLETHQVLGVQSSGLHLETGTAIPTCVLREDPLSRRARVTFAEATAQDKEAVIEQVERLAL